MLLNIMQRITWSESDCGSFWRV